MSRTRESGAGQRETETGATTGRYQLQRASVCRDDPECHRQAKTGAGADRIRRHERLEDARRDLRRHTRPVILKFEHRLIRDRERPDAQCAAAMRVHHRVLRVHHEIRNDLLNFLAVGEHQRQIRPVGLTHVDMGLRQLLLPDRDNGLHDFVQLRQHPLARRAADESRADYG